MRRNENAPTRPPLGNVSVPLFNPRKRNRLPLTSAPSEIDLFSNSGYSEGSPYIPTNTFGDYYPNDGPSSAAPQNYPCDRSSGPALAPQGRQYSSFKPLSTWRPHAPIPHPYKAGTTSSTMGQPRQQRPTQPNKADTNSQHTYRNMRDQHKPVPERVFHPLGQRLPYPQHPPVKYPQKSISAPPSTQPRNSFCSQSSFFEKRKSPQKSQTPRPNENKAESPKKPGADISLRILTSVIDGMRHWSQFKDRFSLLFEIFATLDSAVTVNRHGAKNFMIRTGKDVVQCVYYENEKELPRLIRGQVHRCVGNYDHSRDILTCVSVRPAEQTKQKNFHDAVKACDGEMRKLVKSFREE